MHQTNLSKTGENKKNRRRTHGRSHRCSVESCRIMQKVFYSKFLIPRRDIFWCCRYAVEYQVLTQNRFKLHALRSKCIKQITKENTCTKNGLIPVPTESSIGTPDIPLMHMCVFISCGHRVFI